MTTSRASRLVRLFSPAFSRLLVAAALLLAFSPARLHADTLLAQWLIDPEPGFVWGNIGIFNQLNDVEISFGPLAGQPRDAGGAPVLFQGDSIILL
jgi:hypothetical protein